MDQDKKELDPSELLGGTLNIFGLKLDLGELLASPENVRDRLEELREKLKEAGGKEALSDEEWRQGGMSVTGSVRTHGLMGEREFHVGTLGRSGRKSTGQAASEPPEAMEPPVDVFDEAEEVTIVADVPGAGLDDLELKLEGRTFSLATRPTARRSYGKELHLEADLEPTSLRATCHNGVLEVHVRKRAAHGEPVEP